MDLVDRFRAVDRDTGWELTDRRRLDFPTFHPQGLAVTARVLELGAGVSGSG